MMERFIVKGCPYLERVAVGGEALEQLIIHNVEGELEFSEFDCPNLLYLQFYACDKMTPEQVPSVDTLLYSKLMRL